MNSLYSVMGKMLQNTTHKKSIRNPQKVFSKRVFQCESFLYFISFFVVISLKVFLCVCLKINFHLMAFLSAPFFWGFISVQKFFRLKEIREKENLLFDINRCQIQLNHIQRHIYELCRVKTEKSIIIRNNL